MTNHTFSVYPSDKGDFESKIEPDIKEGKQVTIFCSFTYITPNYSILFTLEGLRKFMGNGNYKVLLVMWDMNTLSNPYFRKLQSLKKIGDADTFINQKIEEIKTLALALGFDRENLLIYKSSDLWKRLISYKEENLFQQFYSLLAQMKIQDYAVSRDKVSHLIQIPMDLFFCNYFKELYPEDLEKEVDLVYFGQNKEALYYLTRELMLKNGLIEHKNPIFILMKNFPYLLHNDCVPEWSMSLRDIKDVIFGCGLTKKDILSVFKHLEEYMGKISVKIEKKIEELGYDEFYKKYNESKDEELLRLLAENMHKYLQECKEKYVQSSGQIEESILNISKKTEVKSIGSVLKSNIALDILLRADGTRNTTKISKELSKSIATTSMYVGKLKKLGLVRVLPNGNIKRNVKGFKINLELGV